MRCNEAREARALTSSRWVAVVDILLHSDAVPYLRARCGVEGGLGLLASLVAGAETELVGSGLVVGSLVETAFVTDLGGVRNGMERKKKTRRG